MPRGFSTLTANFGDSGGGGGEREGVLIGEISSGRGGIGDPGSPLCPGEWEKGGISVEPVEVTIGGGRVFEGDIGLDCCNVNAATCGGGPGGARGGGRGAIL